MAATNIKVAIRVRPLITSEIQKKLKPQWTTQENSIYQINTDGQRIGEPYSFDHIFACNKSNKDIYDEIVDGFIKQTLNGVNSTIFAYGQTSSGKTYTMLGNEKDHGIMSLAIESIFNFIDECISRKFLLRISYLEIYNEKIIDLLNPKKQQEIKIRELYNGQICLQDVTEELVSKRNEVYDLIKLGNKNRHIGDTKMNERSSRSHAIFRIMIESTEINDFDCKENLLQISNLNFVDLAGSERVAQTKATGVRLKEGNHINKSLSTLSLVIKQLSDGKDFINFRDSKLTRLLQDSLGGNSNTLIITTITSISIEDTLSTLNFAQRAKFVKNKPIINEILSEQTRANRYEKLNTQLSKKLEDQLNKIKKLEVEKDVSSKEITHLKEQLNKLRDFQHNGSDFDMTYLNIPKRRHTIAFLQNKQQQQDNNENFDRDYPCSTTSERTSTLTLIKDDLNTLYSDDEDDDGDDDDDDNDAESIPSTPKEIIRNRLLHLEVEHNELIDMTRREEDIINESSKKIVILEKSLDQANTKLQQQQDIIDKLKAESISIKNQRQYEDELLLEQMKNKFRLRENDLLEKINILEDEINNRNSYQFDIDQDAILNQLCELQQILSCGNKYNDNEQQQQEINTSIYVKQTENLQFYYNKIKYELDDNCKEELTETVDKQQIVELQKMNEQLFEYQHQNYELNEQIDNLQTIIEDLNNKIAKFELENNNTNELIDSYKIQIDELYKKNDLQIGIYKNQILEYQQENRNLNNRIEDLKNTVAQFELENNSVHSYKNQIVELQKNNNLQIANYEKQLLEHQQQIEDLQITIKDLNNTMVKLQLENNNANELVDSSKNQITELEKQLLEYQHENRNLNNRIEDLQLNSDNLKIAIDDLNNTIMKLESENKSKEKSIESLDFYQTQIANYEKQLLENQQQNVGLNKQIEDLQISVKDLNNKIVKLELENNNSNERIIELAATNKNQITELERKNYHQISELEKQISEYQHENRNLNKRIEDLQLNCDNFKMIIDDLNNTIMKLESENKSKDKLIESLDFYKNQIVELQKSNDLQIPNYQKQLLEHQQQNIELKQQIDNLQTIIEDLNNKIAKFELENNKSNDSVGFYKERIAALEKTINSEIANQKKQSSSHKNRIEEYKKTIVKFELEINETKEQLNSYKNQVEFLNSQLKENQPPPPPSATTLESKLQKNKEAIEQLIRMYNAYLKSIVSLAELNHNTKFYHDKKIYECIREISKKVHRLVQEYDLFTKNNNNNNNLVIIMKLICETLNLLKQYNNNSFDVWQLIVNDLKQNYESMIAEQKASCIECKKLKQSEQKCIDLYQEYFHQYKNATSEIANLRDTIKMKDVEIRKLIEDKWKLQHGGDCRTTTTTTTTNQIQCDIITMDMLEQLTVKYEYAKKIARMRQEKIEALTKTPTNQ